MGRCGIVADGAMRLRAAIEDEVKREYEPELAKAAGHWDKAKIELKIAKEVKKRLNRLASPYSLWSSHARCGLAAN
jgi:hypothetical protein